MATTCTGSAIAGSSQAIGGLGVITIYEMTLDTTDASGDMTWDLTGDYKYIDAIFDGGSDAATGYVVQITKPADGTAIASDTVKVGIYEAGTDAGALEAVTSTDVSSYIPGLSLVVIGTPAV